MIASSMAVLAAGNGFNAKIFARSTASEERCKSATDGYFGQLVENKIISEKTAKICKAYISYHYEYSGLKDSEIIFESVAENTQAKYQVYQNIENSCPHVRAICSVSSSIIPAELAKEADKYKDRIIVAHPFNPPHLVPYFELCGSEYTADGVVEYAKELLEELGRKPVVLKKPTPGFIGNRLQFALWREALALVEEGVCDPRDIDACLEYSFCPRYTSIGIFEHFDNGGLELNAAACKNIWPTLSNATGIPEVMKNLIDDGKLGTRSQSKIGFYDWNNIDMQEFLARVSAPYLKMINWNLPEE